MSPPPPAATARELGRDAGPAADALAPAPPPGPFAPPGTTHPAGVGTLPYAPHPMEERRRGSGRWFRVTLTLISLSFLTLFVIVPAVNVFHEAFKKGAGAYVATFFPSAPDPARLDAIHRRLDEIERMSFRDRRAARDEHRSLQKEEAALLDPQDRAAKNWAAVRLTLGIVAVVVPLNVLFGIAAAWAMTKFRFKGRSLLVSLIDLPFSVSPVVAGLIFVLLLGMQGFLGAWSRSDRWVSLAPAVRALPALAGVMIATWVAWRLGWAIDGGVWRSAEVRRKRWVGWALILIAVAATIAWSYHAHPDRTWAWILPSDWEWWSPAWRGFGQSWWPFTWEHQVGVIFTPAAIVLASVFVTFPFVARSLIPLMESQGAEAEQAAITLGASGRYTFWRVTLPSIKWGLAYGAILCTARALGEFGAVSVVSGHVESNDTMPLRVEKLWQSYQTQEAFAVASVLALLAVVTLLVKTLIEWKTHREGDDAGEPKPVLSGGRR